ncbi:hypothetical protein [Rickettsiales endosymbiont of Stachyamoeba lipophora]|uniref:hypothetical protein n=1 Tax=Rickettsiales endosymbiont of Stachyamoeba lipophora TaxID=2486578 RepID=UPI000F649D02|nr:hypothetical protein [Rickettsiales endosymbiont of Stachyamoeba lipophora]AZL15980.1 hypothetical protein EF513_05450 [Rickettsiales endosymbiont of Stachyamoeba lipophora]
MFYTISNMLSSNDKCLLRAAEWGAYHDVTYYLNKGANPEAENNGKNAVIIALDAIKKDLSAEQRMNYQHTMDIIVEAIRKKHNLPTVKEAIDTYDYESIEKLINLGLHFNSNPQEPQNLLNSIQEKLKSSNILTEQATSLNSIKELLYRTISTPFAQAIKSFNDTKVVELIEAGFNPSLVRIEQKTIQQYINNTLQDPKLTEKERSCLTKIQDLMLSYKKEPHNNSQVVNIQDPIKPTITTPKTTPISYSAIINKEFERRNNVQTTAQTI